MCTVGCTPKKEAHTDLHRNNSVYTSIAEYTPTPETLKKKNAAFQPFKVLQDRGTQEAVGRLGVDFKSSRFDLTVCWDPAHRGTCRMFLQSLHLTS